MKRMLLFIVIGIIFIAVPVTVYLVSKNQEIRKKAAPATTLRILPPSMIKKVNDLITLEVKIDTADNQVATIQLQIIYDPAKLKTEDITNGPLAPTIRVSGKVDPSGKATITVGAKDNTQPIVGSGTVAIVTMRALAPSATPVSVKFSPYPNTYISALGENDVNVLVSSTGTEISITGDASPTPTPTTIPTITTTPNITISPTVTPEATTSSVTIATPTTNESLTTGTPDFTGNAPANSTVTLTIYSDPQTAVVMTDANGVWTYTPTTPLAAGTHTVVAMVTDPTTGETHTVTTAFTVEDTTGEATESAVVRSVPVSGSAEITIMFIIIGTVLFLSGIVLPVIH